jgi:Dolichyl-phosphate-mannose-protein mannosyltransferase
MSISTTKSTLAGARNDQARHADWQTLLFWAAIVALFAIAIAMRLYNLGLPFDRDSYDEGVYWQSLRAMGAGHALYSDIFYSQPPFFLLSTYPIYALFGASLWSARLGVAVVSLFGLVGALLLGKALSGRLGALAALLLAVVDPLFLAQSQTIQAEASSVAFSFLAMGLALYWWKYPTGRRGLLLAILTGITVALSIMCKLLGVALLVPVALLMVAWLWWGVEDEHDKRRSEGKGTRAAQAPPPIIPASPAPTTNDHSILSGRGGGGRDGWWGRLRRPRPLAPILVRGPNRSYLSIIAGIAAFLLTMLLLTVPFFGSFQALWASIVTFHTDAGALLSGNAQLGQSGNTFKLETALATLLTLAALYGSVVAVLRRDWRVLPLLGWLFATAFGLWRQVPLFPHHFVSLTPPLIALSVMGIAEPAAYKRAFASVSSSSIVIVLTWIAVLLILVTAALDARTDLLYYKNAAARGVDGLAQLEARVAADLDRAIASNQQVVTDAQFIADLASRDTPPALVDTSMVRITTGSITLTRLESLTDQPQVHAVLFFTGRFGLPEVAAFHTWVARRFHLLHNYGGGRELWVR